MPHRSGVFLCIEARSVGSFAVAQLELALALEGLLVRKLPVLKPGTDRAEALERELSTTKAALVIVSRSRARPAYQDGALWSDIEIEAILRQVRRGLLVIPVRIDGATENHLPQSLRHLEAIQFQGEKVEYWEPEFARLRDVLKDSESGDFEPDSDLYFSSLEINNLRCFKVATTLDLSSRWNVILGDNGTGKTTLLRTLASFSPNVHVEWADAGNVAASFVGADEAVSVRGGVKMQLIYGYGAGRGAAVAPIELSDPRSGTCATLMNESAPLPDPQEWILQSFLTAKIENGEKSDESFQRIKEILCRKLLPEVYDLIPAVGENRVPRVEAVTPDGTVPMKDLSFGYNVAMSWIVDLARRMFRRYADSPDPLGEHAIVLVDEIDLHLHPKWQRELLRSLDTIFKKTQFIVTAHSPLIVQCAPNANLALLRREGDSVVIDNDVDYVRKWRVDQILASELFGEQPTHAPEVEKLFEEMIELKSKHDLTEDEKSRLTQVETELDALPTATNPSDIQAMDIIRKAAERLSR